MLVPSEIVRLAWPCGHPSDLPNFESEARRLRYQALGRACLRHDIDSLFLAHHADDQAETVLMRLAASHGCIGLQGMRPNADIPESQGIYGLHRSGMHEHYTRRNNPQYQLWEGPHYTKDPGRKSLRFEQDGITIHRPFLLFSKDRLKATCLAAGVQWVEDQTNQDVTKTPRNAIRSLLQSERLPLPLRTKSLITLADTARAHVKHVKKAASEWFLGCHFWDLNNHVGLLKVQLPPNIVMKGWPNLPVEKAERLEERHQFKVGLLIQQLVRNICATHAVELSSLQTAARVLSMSQHEAVTGFTAGGVRFQRSPFPMPIPLNPYSPPSYLWTLTREPYHRSQPLPILPIEATEGRPEDKYGYVPIQFRLWDGRFWIAVKHRRQYKLCIRPFRQEDMEICSKSVNKITEDDFRKVLREHAPDDTRWTLPAIAFMEGKLRVLALPSLGITFGEAAKIIQWKIRYKAVDLKALYESAYRPKHIVELCDEPSKGNRGHRG